MKRIIIFLLTLIAFICSSLAQIKTIDGKEPKKWGLMHAGRICYTEPSGKVKWSHIDRDPGVTSYNYKCNHSKNVGEYLDIWFYFDKSQLEITYSNGSDYVKYIGNYAVGNNGLEAIGEAIANDGSGKRCVIKILLTHYAKVFFGTTFNDIEAQEKQYDPVWKIDEIQPCK